MPQPGATFLPVQLPPSGPVSNNTLNLLQTTRSNGIQLSNGAMVPGQPGIFSNAPLSDCNTTLNYSTLDYNPQLMSGQLAQTNLLNAFGPQQTYYMDSSGIPTGAASTMVVGSGANIPALPPIYGFSSASNTTAAVASVPITGTSQTASMGHATTIPTAAHFQHVGLYSMGQQVPTMQPGVGQPAVLQNDPSSFMNVLAHSQSVPPCIGMDQVGNRCSTTQATQAIGV